MTPPQQEAAAQLDALRAAGAERLDPVRFHTLHALVRRLGQQPAPVQALLQERLAAGLQACKAHVEQQRQARSPARAAPRVRSPLAQLNASLREAAPDTAGSGELESARRFRDTWERKRSQDQLEQAVARKPAQPGPLNSHALVLQALERMRELSPDYLRRFLLHVESLQWLEAAREQYPQKKAKGAKPPAKKARARK